LSVPLIKITKFRDYLYLAGNPSFKINVKTF